MRLDLRDLEKPSRGFFRSPVYQRKKGGFAGRTRFDALARRCGGLLRTTFPIGEAPEPFSGGSSYWGKSPMTMINDELARRRAQREESERRRHREFGDRDDCVLSFAQWCRVNGFSLSTGRRIKDFR
jgi:hypothetical protein